MQDSDLINILQQNWSHIEHMESERLHFTSVYVVIVAAVFGYFSYRNSSLDFFISLLLVVFSILGLCISLKIAAEIHNHIKAINRIVTKLKVKEYSPLPLDEGWKKYIKVRYAFHIFYSIMSVVSLYLCLKSLGGISLSYLF